MHNIRPWTSNISLPLARWREGREKDYALLIVRDSLTKSKEGNLPSCLVFLKFGQLHLPCVVDCISHHLISIFIAHWERKRRWCYFDCCGKRSDQTVRCENFFAFPQILGCPLVWGRVQSRMSEDWTKRGVKAGVKVTTEKLSRVGSKERGSRNVDMSIKPCSLNLPFYFS